MEFLNSVESFWIWLILAALLAIGEIAIAPGIFLIFVAAAAAGVGVITSLIDMSVTAQLAMFALLSLASVFLGRKWYSRSDVENADPLLNDRAARMVGQSVTVIEDVSANSGRVRVGDSEWPARGPNLKSGSKARIACVEAGIVQLEKAE